MEIIDIPITPAPTSNEEKMTEEPVKRNYSQRRMQATSIMHMSDTTKRRLTEKGFEVIQKGFNCNKSQASEIAQLVCKKQLGTLKATEDTPNTNVTNNNTQNFQESQLRPECLENVMKTNTTFTEDEKFAVVESFANCKTREEKVEGLKHLKSIMAPKDSRYDSIDITKLGRWTDRYDRIKNGEMDEKRGKRINVDFENDIWAELLLCAIEMKEEEGKMEEKVEVLFNVCYSYSIIRQAAEGVARSEKWEKKSSYPNFAVLQQVDYRLFE